MNLFTANRQWATRPDDEKFKTVEELYNATKAYYETAKEQVVPIDSVRTEANNGDVTLIGKKNVPATFTHWSFGQLCARVGAPANYLRELPATLACQNLNHGLKEYTPADEVKNVNLLFHSNGSLLLRSFTSDKYTRIWNWEVAQRLLGLQQYGWNPAMPDINKGAFGEDKPPLYASDHDLFVFLANDNYRIAEAGNPDGLKRGTIVVNSEVGASSLKFMHFLYRGLCANHIIWGASKLTEIRVRHVGNAHERWGHYQAQLTEYLESSATEQESKIAESKTIFLGTDKDAVLDKLFAQRSLGLSRKVLEAGFEAVNQEQDGSPRSVWGMVQGLTRYSQTLPYADERTAVDIAAGKLMEAIF
jgi:hypothetical protein